jgi:hypothetical protein
MNLCYDTLGKTGTRQPKGDVSEISDSRNLNDNNQHTRQANFGLSGMETAVHHQDANKALLRLHDKETLL